MAWGCVELRLENFRCFESLRLEPVPSVNVIAGDNASGKTSLLEALFFLGRGTSFRAARADMAIRQGSEAGMVFGRLLDGEHCQRLGLEISRASGLTIRVDGAAGNRAALAGSLPVQLLDPGSHELVQGGPAARRQFLDWSVFHVEPGFLPVWQRYRRALQQRNAALRAGGGQGAWAWDGQLAEAGEALDRMRRDTVQALDGRVPAAAARLLGEGVELSYSAGWEPGSSLVEALAGSRARDSLLGSTQVGPHRADLALRFSGHRARERVSRGQEKLLAAALTLAQVELVAGAIGHPVMLLVDEPGADLDRERLDRLLEALWAAPAQIFVTTLDPAILAPPPGGRLFHVEHGKLRDLL